MKANKRVASEQATEGVTVTRPRLVKATELEARRAAAIEEAARPKERPAYLRPVLTRAPRGEDEARQMFDSLFQAA